VEYRGSLGVHFYDQNVAAVVFAAVGPGDQRPSEVLLACAFTLRQIANLGSGSIVRSIASLLLAVPGGLSALAHHDSPGGPELIAYTGSPAKRRFIGELRHRGHDYGFNLGAHGFGILAQGMGFYAPSSIFLMLRYLARKRLSDDLYVDALEKAAQMCGSCAHNGQVASRSQHELALTIALDAAAELTAGPVAGQSQGREAAPSIDDLLGLLETPGPVLQFPKLDLATRVAIERSVRVMGAMLAHEHPEAVPSITSRIKSEIGKDVFTGYVVGRRVLGSHGTRIQYSDGDAEAIQFSQRLATKADETPQRADEVAAKLFAALAETSTERQPYAGIRDKNLAATFIIVAMMNGLSLAYAENALARGGAEE